MSRLDKACNKIFSLVRIREDIECDVVQWHSENTVTELIKAPHFAWSFRRVYSVILA